MRTTVSFEKDAYELIQRAMRERGIGFKDTVNAAIREGLRPSRAKRAPFRVEPFALGAAIGVDAARFNQLLDEVLGADDAAKIARLEK